MSKVRQLIIKSFGKFCAFAETKNGNEDIYVPFFARGKVNKTPCKVLVSSPDAPKYHLDIGDVIVAEIEDGDRKRRRTKVWVPLSAWKGREVKIHKAKVVDNHENAEPRKEDSPKAENPAKEISFLEKIDLPFLDPYLLGEQEIQIRVRPPSGHGQIYYGPASTLFSGRVKASTLEKVNNLDNVFEAIIDGEWVQIWPPVVELDRLSQSILQEKKA